MAEARLDGDQEPARPAPAPDDPGARAARDRRRSDRARVVEVVALLGGAALIPVLCWHRPGPDHVPCCSGDCPGG